MKLIVAMERLREKNPQLYGNERITIGFWVGGMLLQTNSVNSVISLKRKTLCGNLQNRSLNARTVVSQLEKIII